MGFFKKRLLIRNCLSKMLLFLICNFYFIFYYFKSNFCQFINGGL
nr:MAG TPA: hypothetical protein [Caudoviricetes sp.]